MNACAASGFADVGEERDRVRVDDLRGLRHLDALDLIPRGENVGA